MAYEITIKRTGYRPQLFKDATGWGIGSPEGFIQLVTEDQVFYYPVQTVQYIAVPNLSEDADVVQLREA